MNRKFATYLGLPVALVLGIVAVALALGFLGTQPAPVSALSDSLSATSNSETFGSVPDSAKVLATTSTTATTVSPTTPGAAAEFSIEFFTDAQVPASTGQIRITFDKDIGMPTSISRDHVTIISDAVTTGSGGAACVAGLPVRPSLDPTIIDDTVDNRRKQVRITVPDMDPATTGACTTVQSIAANATVTVTFSQVANIRNPGEAVASNEVFVTTNVAGDVAAPGVAAPYATFRELTVAPVSGVRNSTVTVTGKGFKSGVSPQPWLDRGVDLDGDGDIDGTELDTVNETVAGVDLNGDGDALDTSVGTFDETVLGYDINNDGDVLDTAVGTIQETDLRDNGKQEAAEFIFPLTPSNVVVQADGTFTATFIAGPALATGANQINAGDGLGTVPFASNPTFAINGRIELDLTEASRGDNITVRLRDYTNGAVTSVTIGGATATLVSCPAVATNTTDCTVTVPNTAPVGLQRVTVVAGAPAETRNFDFLTVRGAPMTVSPTTAVPNTTLTVQGSGFTANSTISTITLGGVSVTPGTAPTTDNGGVWNAEVVVPVNTTTLQAGTYEVRATDAGGRIGTAQLTIPARTLSINPTESGLRSTITVTGAGFPSSSTRTGTTAFNVAITYAGTSRVNPTPDTSGNFTATFTVPATASIPSDNNVVATVTAGSVTATTSVIHKVPSSSITVSPEQGPSGSTATVIGSGFPTFTTLTTLTIGGINALPSPAPATDANGTFTATILIPGLDIGSQTVRVTIGGTTGTALFTITESGTTIPPGPTATPGEATTALGTNLVRVWNFNNETKAWTFYDPRPPFADANTLTQIAANRVYWVRINTTPTQAFSMGPCGQVGPGTNKPVTAGWNLIPC